MRHSRLYVIRGVANGIDRMNGTMPAAKLHHFDGGFKYYQASVVTGHCLPALSEVRTSTLFLCKM